MVKISGIYEPRPCRRTQLESKKSDAAQLPLFNEPETTAVEAVREETITYTRKKKERGQRDAALRIFPWNGLNTGCRWREKSSGSRARI